MDAVAAYGSIVSRSRRDDSRGMDAYRSPAYGAHISGRMFAGYAIPGPYYVEALSRRGPV